MVHAVIFKGTSQYDALRVFADHFARGLEERGVDVECVDLTESNPIARLQTIIALKKIDIFFSFNGVQSDLKAGGGQGLYDALGAVFFSIYVDHPLTHIDRIKAGPKRTILSFVDEGHKVWAETALPRGSYLKALFLPHGGIRADAPPAVRGERDFMFAASYHAHADHMWRTEPLDKTLVAVIDAVYGDWGRAPERPFRAVFTAALRRLRLNLPAELRDEIEKVAFHFVNRQRVLENRRNLLAAFEARGLPLDIYGPEAWADYCAARPGFSYKGQIGMEEQAAVIGRYKFVLNDNNDFQNGSHERVFNALANAAIPITPKNDYYATLQATKDYALMFDRATLKGLPETLPDFHAVYEGRIEALTAANDALYDGISWRHRAAEALEAARPFL